MQAIRSAIAVSALALAPCAGLAQEQEPLSDPIVVEADRPYSAEEVKSLARKIGSKIDLLRPFPRFNEPLCLDVAGLKDEYRDSFVRRVTENARIAGLKIAKPDCRPNAMILFADDSRQQLIHLRKHKRDLFGDMPRSEFKTMLAARDRVYAWQIIELADVDGRQLDIGTSVDIGTVGVPVLRTFATGRLSPQSRLITKSSVVVIDRSQIDGKTAEQLADYATMRLIAPIGELPEAAAEGPTTIMTLFQDPAAAPPSMTAIDMAFLESVYKVRPTGPSGFVFVETAKRVTRANGQ